MWVKGSFGVLCGSFLPCVRFLGTADKENRSRRSGLCSSDSTRNQLGVEFYSGCLELRCPMCRHFSFGSGTWLGTCNANRSWATTHIRDSLGHGHGHLSNRRREPRGTVPFDKVRDTATRYGIHKRALMLWPLIGDKVLQLAHVFISIYHLSATPRWPHLKIRDHKIQAPVDP